MDDRARQDLALIRRIMQETRGEAVDRGKHLLIWGVISAAGLGATWAAAVGRLDFDPRWMWAGLLAAGWLASSVVGWTDARRAGARPAGRRLLSVVWVATGVTMTLIGTAGLFGSVVDVRALPGLLSTVLGAAYLSTALLIGERWIGWLAVGWWAAGGAMLFFSGVHTLLAMAAMALGGMVVPGAVLYHRSRGGRGGAEVVADPV